MSNTIQLLLELGYTVEAYTVVSKMLGKDWSVVRAPAYSGDMHKEFCEYRVLVKWTPSVATDLADFEDYLSEYYGAVPVRIHYRGHNGMNIHPYALDITYNIYQRSFYSKLYWLFSGVEYRVDRFSRAMFRKGIKAVKAFVGIAHNS